jgi:hypothetical protein
MHPTRIECECLFILNMKNILLLECVHTVVYQDKKMRFKYTSEMPVRFYRFSSFFFHRTWYNSCEYCVDITGDVDIEERPNFIQYYLMSVPSTVEGHFYFMLQSLSLPPPICLRKHRIAKAWPTPADVFSNSRKSCVISQDSRRTRGRF